MINENVLDIVMRVELAMLTLAVLLFFVHGLWLFVRKRRRDNLVQKARAHLVSILSGGQETPQDYAFIRRMPREIRSAVFLELSHNVSGTAKDRLREAAAQTGLLTSARQDCRSSRWKDRLRGAAVMGGLEEPDEILGTLLYDRNPAVRAQVAEWAASQPDVHIVNTLLDLLADPETLSRFAVQDSLLRMGRTIVDPLSRYLEKHFGSAAVFGLELAEAVAEPAFLPAALFHSANGPTSVRVAATSLLAAIGDEGATGRLAELLADPIPEVRAAAASGLGRLRHWRSAPQLLAMLGDQSWQVKRQSAMALRLMGGPGVLMLRRASASSDPAVSDIAQMMLDSPLQGTGR